MRNIQTILTFASIILGLISWTFPDIPMVYKLIFSIIIILSIIYIYIQRYLNAFFQKFWQEIISFALIGIGLSIIYIQFKDFFIPSIIISIVNFSIILLLIRKSQSRNTKTILIYSDSFEIPSKWHINHWKSNVTSFVNNTMVFQGLTVGTKGEDGSHIDLPNLLNIGKDYLITCHVQSDTGTTAQFRLWCHDNIDKTKSTVSQSTDFKTPSNKGEKVLLRFTPVANRNIRIHLQYKPGNGRIIVHFVEIYMLND